MSVINPETPERVDPDALSVFEAAAYTIPRVNLLPPEIAERRKLRQLQAGLGAFVIALGGVVGLLYVQAGSGEANAQSELQSAQAQHQVLQQRASGLASVQVSKARVDAAKASLKAAMGSEVLWSKTLEELQQRLPDGVRFSNVAVVGQGPLSASGASSSSASTSKAATTSSSAPGSSQLPSNAIATVTIQGQANTMDDVATELDQLAQMTGFTNVYLTSVTQAAQSGSNPTVTYNATAVITNVVLSHRYDNIGASQ